MTETAFYNPYSDVSFLGFFQVFFARLWSFLQGNLGFQGLASDEIQIIVLAGVATSSALVGSFLILRKMTMLANSLSHTILLGIVGAFFLTKSGYIHAGQQEVTTNIHIMLLASLIMGLLTAFLTEFLTKTVRLQEDASIGLVFTSLFALGIILITLITRNAHIGTEVVMGNVDALHVDDCKLVYAVLGINIFLFAIFFKEYKMTTFDPAFAKVLGFSTAFFNYLLMIQVSATTISAFRAVGVLMVLAFITGPVLTARLFTHDLRKMIALAIFISILSSLIGVAVSRHLLSIYGMAFSTAGIVVCTLVFFFILGWITRVLNLAFWRQSLAVR